MKTRHTARLHHPKDVQEPDAYVGRAEGKIKADGTTLGHRAKISWSAHWLGDGARHRPEGGAVPRLGETSMFAQLFAALWVVLLCFCIDRLHRCR
jgi:hypothetical protein